MIEMILFLAVYGLVIRGIHYTTRPDKILSFLGVYISVDDASSLNATNTEKAFLLHSFIEDYAESDDKEKLTKTFVDGMNEMYIPFSEQEERVDEVMNRKSWQLIKPFAPALTECLVCMSSFWGILFYILHFQLNWIDFQLAGVNVFAILVAVFAMAGLQGTVKS